MNTPESGSDAAPPAAQTLGAGVVKRTARLADGRELFYYDDPGTTLGPERAVDARELAPRPATATMRRDVLTGDWVSIAAARQNRAFLPPAELDPLAPQTPTNPSEIPSMYDVAVFENKSPSFGPALAVAGIDALVSTSGEALDGTPGEALVGTLGKAPASTSGEAPTSVPGEALVGTDPPRGLDDLDAPGLGRTRTSVGRCEVVCFSPAHSGSFGSLTPTRARTVIEAWADRTAALSALPGVEQVFPFENRGEAIGVTLPHPHGQIYAYPYITPRTATLLGSIEREGPDLFARILDFELADDRVILSGEHWTAFVPFAARWPIEVHLMPHRHVADLAETTAAERDELAPLYLRLLRGIDALYDSPTPYIAAWHQAPVHRGRDTVRLHLQLTSPRRAADKLKFLAGSEAAMGAWIGDIPPETSAARLRDAVASVPEETL
ncbi:galactose-1-phosphate uridylyltransferase [Microbacterium sp. I2]|uniref:galactose-1-phosphate uridylyltransferase n=1 Tax=Microbacterium sp. I2 TaxID=3391826 RepID=UPI003ED88C02